MKHADIEIYSSLEPATSGIYSLGTSGKTFSILYIEDTGSINIGASTFTANISGDIVIDSKTHAKSFEVGDLQYIAGGESVTPDLNEYGLFEYTLSGSVTLNAAHSLYSGFEV